MKTEHLLRGYESKEPKEPIHVKSTQTPVLVWKLDLRGKPTAELWADKSIGLDSANGKRQQPEPLAIIPIAPEHVGLPLSELMKLYPYTEKSDGKGNPTLSVDRAGTGVDSVPSDRGAGVVSRSSVLDEEVSKSKGADMTPARIVNVMSDIRVAEEKGATTIPLAIENARYLLKIAAAMKRVELASDRLHEELCRLSESLSS